MTNENAKLITMLTDCELRTKSAAAEINECKDNIRRLEEERDSAKQSFTDKLSRLSQDHDIEVKRLRKEHDEVRNEMKKQTDLHDSKVKQLAREIDDLKLTLAKQSEIHKIEMKQRDNLLKYATDQGM